MFDDEIVCVTKTDERWSIGVHGKHYQSTAEIIDILKIYIYLSIYIKKSLISPHSSTYNSS